MNARQCRSDCARWLHRVEADIIEVAAHKHIYTELREIVSKNPQLHGRSAFWTYLIETYRHYVAAAVRRQVKIDRGAASMARVLNHLAETPNAIDREWFVSRFANARRSSSKEIARVHAWFDQYAGSGREFLNSDLVRADLAELRRGSQVVEEYVDRLIAHSDLTAPSRLPKLGEIHAAVDLLVALLEKYYPPVCGGLLEVDPSGSVDDDWKDLFRTKWIR